MDTHPHFKLAETLLNTWFESLTNYLLVVSHQLFVHRHWTEMQIMAKTTLLSGVFTAFFLENTKVLDPSPGPVDTALNVLWFLSLALSLFATVAFILATWWLQQDRLILKQFLSQIKRENHGPGRSRSFMRNLLDRVTGTQRILSHLPLIVAVSVILFLAGLLVKFSMTYLEFPFIAIGIAFILLGAVGCLITLPNRHFQERPVLDTLKENDWERVYKESKKGDYGECLFSYQSPSYRRP